MNHKALRSEVEGGRGATPRCQPRAATCALAVNEMWSMSFVSDALFDNRRLRELYRDHAGWKLADIVDQRGGA